MSVPLMPSATGYVNVTSLNPVLVGSWYAYGDNIGNNGMPPGNCQTKGGHTDAQCSSITFPPIPTDGGTGSFPQTTPGTMCLSGTAAKVIAGEAGTDYSNIFGIGIGLDLNNSGGTKAPYDTTMAHITGFSFTVAGLPTTGSVRVEIPIPVTDPSGDAWSYTLTGNGSVTVNLVAGAGMGQLAPSFTMSGQPMFDPTMVESVQFHIVTNTMASIPVDNFCISDLAAIVCQ
jgi:hypothetical protein